MTLALFCLCTYVLPGLAGAVVWRAVLGRRAAQRPLDTLVWLAGSPFLVAGAYQVALWLAPGRPSRWYTLAIPLAFLLPLVVLPRGTWRTILSIGTAVQRLLRPLLGVRRGTRTALRWSREAATVDFTMRLDARRVRTVVRWVVALALLATTAVYVRVGSMALNETYFVPLLEGHGVPVLLELDRAEGSPLVYATQGWQWHQRHDPAYWQPGRPDARGFRLLSPHGPGYELLHAWAADWMGSRFADAPMRTISLASHLAAALVLAIVAAPLGRWGPFWAGLLFLSVPQAAFAAVLHWRDPLQLLGFLLLLAAMQRCRRLPLGTGAVGIGLAAGAAFTAHLFNFLAFAGLAVGWVALSRRGRGRLVALFLLAGALGLAVGGKQYARNYATTGALGGPAHTTATFKGAADRWTELAMWNDHPRGLLALWDYAWQHSAPRAGYLVALGALVIGAVVLVARRGEAPPWRRGMTFRMAAAGAGLSLLYEAWVIPAQYLWTTRQVGHVEDYRFVPLTAFAVLLVPAALAAFPRWHVGRWAVTLLASLVAVANGAYLWSQTHVEPQRREFPASARRTEAFPVVDPYVLERIETAVAGAPVLVVDVPEVFYYTGMRGRSFRDPAVSAIYQASTPAAMRETLLRLGFRYIVSWDDGPTYYLSIDHFHKVLGFGALFDDPRLCRVVESRAVTRSRTITLFDLLPERG